jgi:hypothetical protein
MAAYDDGWRSVRGVAYLFLVLLAISVGGYAAARAGCPEALADAIATCLMALVVVIATVAAWPDLKTCIARTGGLRGLGVAAGGFLLMLLFGAAYFSTLRWLGLPVVSPLPPFVASEWPLWSAYLLIAAAPAILEEFGFRGYVMARLDRLFTPTETLLVQAALFSVLHFSVVIFPSHFVFGLLLGLVRRRTGSLYPGILVHAAWNGLIVTTDDMGIAFP